MILCENLTFSFPDSHSEVGTSNFHIISNNFYSTYNMEMATAVNKIADFVFDAIFTVFRQILITPMPHMKLIFISIAGHNIYIDSIEKSSECHIFVIRLA